MNPNPLNFAQAIALGVVILADYIVANIEIYASPGILPRSVAYLAMDFPLLIIFISQTSKDVILSNVLMIFLELIAIVNLCLCLLTSRVHINNISDFQPTLLDWTTFALTFSVLLILLFTKRPLIRIFVGAIKIVFKS
jgi:hypothetical protein